MPAEPSRVRPSPREKFLQFIMTFVAFGVRAWSSQVCVLNLNLLFIVGIGGSFYFILSQFIIIFLLYLGVQIYIFFQIIKKRSFICSLSIFE